MLGGVYGESAGGRFRLSFVRAGRALGTPSLPGQDRVRCVAVMPAGGGFSVSAEASDLIMCTALRDRSNRLFRVRP